MNDYYNPEWAYEKIRTYRLDLGARLQHRDEWKQRHPDGYSAWYDADRIAYERDVTDDAPWEPSGNSTFDPNDPEPNTSDRVSAEMWQALCVLAVAAYQKAGDL